MKLAFAALVASVAVLLMGQAAFQWGTQVGCTSETHACSSGSCSRPVPDGGAGADAGLYLENVRGYTVRVCGTSARPLAGAGTLKDYHCVAADGTCPEVPLNAQPVTLAAVCQEFPPFVLPAQLPAADRMVWASSGVTISNWDGGAADTVTVTVCPAQ